ncbi:MAG TPA: nuclear transport factor 2 family protein [Longimicrobiaceae bacterium]|nr:nuclear transport factor 2 family protein [Longimicrobiaceae bacterium]
MSTEQQIRDCVDRFYAALDQALNGDPEPMLALWSHGPEATAQHPGGGRHVGWDEVEGAWRGWSQHVASGRIAGEEVSIRLLTPDVAAVAAVERGEGSIAGETVEVDARATLVLRRDGSGWRVVHHHVDLVPAIREIAERALASGGVAGAGAS